MLRLSPFSTSQNNLQFLISTPLPSPTPPPTSYTCLHFEYGRLSYIDLLQHISKVYSEPIQLNYSYICSSNFFNLLTFSIGHGTLVQWVVTPKQKHAVQPSGSRSFKLKVPSMHLSQKFPSTLGC